jgi:hypothetical protein
MTVTLLLLVFAKETVCISEIGIEFLNSFREKSCSSVSILVSRKLEIILSFFEAYVIEGISCISVSSYPNTLPFL